MEKVVCGNFYDKVFTQEDLDNLLACPVGLNDDGIIGDIESFDTTTLEEIAKEAYGDKEDEINSLLECFDGLGEKSLALQDMGNELADYLNIRGKLIEYYDNIEGIMYYYLYRKFAFTVIPKIININSQKQSLIEYLTEFNDTLFNLVEYELNFKYLIEFLNFTQTMLLGIQDGSKSQTELLADLSFDISGNNLPDILNNNLESFQGLILDNMELLPSTYSGYTTNVEIDKKDIVNEISNTIKDVKFFDSKIHYYRYIETKEDVLLDDITYFDDIISDNYKIEDKDVEKVTSGVLYDEYYNLLPDLLNNFFTEEERGITQNADNIDTTYKSATVSGQTISKKDMATVKMSSSDTEYYVADDEKYKEFFSTLQDNLEPTLLKKKIERLDSYRHNMMSQLRLLALSEAGYFSTKYNNSNNTNLEFVNIYDSMLEYFFNLLTEIKRLNDKIEEIKSEMSSDKFTESLKSDLSCFGDMDDYSNIEEADGSGSNWKQFPTFNPDTLEIENALNPEDPTFEKHCYWLQFAKLATLYGLMPFPDLFPKNPIGLGLRYWPVGLKIPTPAKIINIPLPVIWIPLITLSVPAIGTFVFFIGQCGIFPSPFLFYINPAGIKKFIVTLRGQSDPIGYDPSGDEMKFRFNVPLSMWKANLKIDNPLEEQDMEKFVKGESFEDFKTSTINRMLDSINSWGSPDMKNFKEAKNKIKFEPTDEYPTPESQEYQEQLDKYSGYVSELVSSITSDFADYIEGLKFPKISIPGDSGKMANKQPTQQLFEMTKRYENYDLKTPPLEEFDLKTKLNQALNTTKFTPELQAYRFPETIDLENPTHFNLVLDYMKVWVELSLRFIGANQLFFSLLDMPEFKISSPLQCKTLFESPAFNTISTQVLETFIKLVWAAIDVVDIATATNYIGITKFSAKYLAGTTTSLLNAIIPNFALPTAEFVSTVKTSMLPALKASMLSFVPEIQFAFPTRSTQIEIDTGIVRDSLAQLVRGMSPAQDFFPFQIPTTPSVKNMGGYVEDLLNVNDIDFKLVITNIVQTQADSLLNQFKPIYDGVNAGMSLYNFKQSIMDFVMLPKAMIQMAAKTLRQRGIENAIEIPNWYLIELAFKAMEYIEFIPFPVVGGLSAIGLSDLIRAIHPIMPMDDLPPWERLTLKNLLFVLFLDDFCHNGKMYGGFQENFLP